MCGSCSDILGIEVYFPALQRRQQASIVAKIQAPIDWDAFAFERGRIHLRDRRIVTRTLRSDAYGIVCLCAAPGEHKRSAHEADRTSARYHRPKRPEVFVRTISRIYRSASHEPAVTCAGRGDGKCHYVSRNTGAIRR